MSQATTTHDPSGKHTLEYCRERGARHKAYGWIPQQRHNIDERGRIGEPYNEEQFRAYMEGYYGTEGGYGPGRAALTGDALKAKVDECVANVIRGWEEENAARKASGRPDSDFAPQGFGP